jgi:hypothetical protein
VTETRYVYFADHNEGWISICDHDRGGKPDDIKIGITIGLAYRMRELHAQLILAVPCEYAFAAKLEAALHAQFDQWRVFRTEWFHRNTGLEFLINRAMLLDYWPWDRTRIIRGTERV